MLRELNALVKAANSEPDQSRVSSDCRDNQSQPEPTAHN
jgi:hypothetical protein